MKKYYNEPNPFADVGTKKVLIVEDDRSHRTLMDKILKSFGLVSVQAENGIQALERLQRGEKFDLIIMDWDMPVMDGIEATRRIRELLQMAGPGAFSNSAKKTQILLHTATD